MSDALQERYAAIEREYSQGQWQQVLSNSAALLAELPNQPDHPLRIRLSLLQGHTLLYGIGQVAEAAAIYQQVLDSQPEPVLQNIAAQELERCRSLLEAALPNSETTDTPAAPEPVGASFPFTAEPVGVAVTQQHAAAMPWLDALGGVDPAASLEPAAAGQPPWMQAQPLEPKAPEPVAADVIDEPEQIEVHQADPARAEVVDLAMEPIDASNPGDAEPEPETMKTTVWPSRWSSAEEAELARGILTVVLR